MKAVISESSAYHVTGIGELAEFKDSVRFQIDTTLFLNTPDEPVFVVYGDGRWSVTTYEEADRLVQNDADVHQIVPMKAVLEDFITFDSSQPVIDLCPLPTT